MNTPAIVALLEALGFQPTPGNANTWYRNIPESEANGIAGVRAYIKFGNGKWKGFRYYTVKGCTGMMFYARDGSYKGTQGEVIARMMESGESRAARGYHSAIGELECLRVFKHVRDLILEDALKPQDQPRGRVTVNGHTFLLKTGDRTEMKPNPEFEKFLEGQ